MCVAPGVRGAFPVGGRWMLRGRMCMTPRATLSKISANTPLGTITYKIPWWQFRRRAKARRMLAWYCTPEAEAMLREAIRQAQSFHVEYRVTSRGHHDR